MERARRRLFALATAASAWVATTGPAPAFAGQPEPSAAIVIVDRDDVVVSGSVLVQFTGVPIEDANGDGVLHIEGDGSVVRLLGTLRGADETTAPEDLRGIGIRVRGTGVSIAGGRVEGFRVGLEARGTDGLAIVETRFDGGFRPRLASPASPEDPGDRRQPQENDEGRWTDRASAALRVTDAREVSIRDVTVRRWQNGILLERVTDSIVADCDASFLPGRGLAMWRVERSLVARNAFDFCVRDSSPGVHAGSPDSAGILMLERCSDNRILRNSATHGGHGLSAPGGPGTPDEPAVPADGGHRGNLVAENDFSHAAIRGLSLAAAFDTRVHANRLTDAASPAEPSREHPEASPASPPVDVDAMLREAGLGPGRDPRGARSELGGRDAIVMGEYGPWDHEGLVLQRLPRSDLYDEWMIHGPEGVVDPRSLGERLSVSGDVRITRRATSFAVLPEVQPLVSPYELRLPVPGRPDLLARGTVRRSQWDGLVFPWQRDPVTDPEGWRGDASRFGVPFRRFGLRLPFGDQGPSDGLLGPLRRDAGIAADRFGIVASTELEFPSGRWRLLVRSDDGVRVLMDGVVVLEDWTVHTDRWRTHEFTVDALRRIPVEVEYFEQTGDATLDVDFAWVGPLEAADG